MIKVNLIDVHVGRLAHPLPQVDESWAPPRQDPGREVHRRGRREGEAEEEEAGGGCQPGYQGSGDDEGTPPGKMIHSFMNFSG